MNLLLNAADAIPQGGGTVTLKTWSKDDRVYCSVTDTGAGLNRAGDGLGTGLSTLRERLQLVFGGDAKGHLAAIHPHGARAELDFPAQPSQA